MTRGKLAWVLMFVVGLAVGFAPFVMRQMAKRGPAKPAAVAAAPGVSDWYMAPPADWPPGKTRDLRAMNEEIVRDPGNAKLFIWRSMIYGEAKDHEAALSDIDEALKLEAKQRYYFLFMRHRQLDALGRTDEALADVLEAIELAPSGAGYQRHAADIYRRKGDVNAGVAVFDESVRRAPDDLNLLAERAKFLNAVGRHGQALRDISASIEGEPTDFHRQMRTFDRMKILTAMRRYDDALEDADRMVDEFPDQSLAYGLRSEVYAAMGDHKAARRDEEKKLDILHSSR
jgi:tetratricopeptide (TPR) repeat protein